MLPVLVMSCLRAGLARARYTFPDFRPPKAFWEDLLSRPLLFLCPCGTRIHTNENRRKCPVASDSGITRKPKIPIIFYCSGTIRAGRSCRSISRGRTSVFGPGSGGTPSRRTIRRGGRHKVLWATHTIPHSGCSRQALRRKRSLKSGSRGGLRIEFFIKWSCVTCSVGAAPFFKLVFRP